MERLDVQKLQEIHLTLASVCASVNEFIVHYLLTKNITRIDSQNVDSEVISDLDISVNQFLVNGLAATNLPVVSEETVQDKDETDLVRPGLYWLIDPIDGSFNALYNTGPFAVSMALMLDGRPLLGGIVLPMENVVCTGGEWQGCRIFELNGCSSSGSMTTAKPIVYSGIPHSLNLAEAGISQKYFHMFGLASKVRMIGSASYSLYQVAVRQGIYFEIGIRLWDVAAGLAIVKGAGLHYWIQRYRSMNTYAVVAGDRRAVEQFADAW